MTLQEIEKLDAALLCCLFCGGKSDRGRNEDGDGYLGCQSLLCRASDFAMTDDEWNSRDVGMWLDYANAMDRKAAKL